MNELLSIRKPCLFDYATSELSQDAFLAYVLAWADGRHFGAMHDFGRLFLRKVFELAKIPFPDSPLNVIVKRQHCNIDVFCEINGSDYALIIEDKINASEHDNQLLRYKENIEKEKKYKNVLCVYCKTGDQSNFKNVKDAGYAVMNRPVLMSLLESPEGKRACDMCEIVADFAYHLQFINQLVESYKTEPLDKWNWNAWKGFFTALQSDAALGEGDWGYVSNPAGGFLGFWWHWRTVENGEVYLQLEENKACFKVAVNGDAAERAQDMKYSWNERFIKANETVEAASVIAVVRPHVLRVGMWMTVATLKDDYRIADAEGRLDLSATIENLKAMGTVLDTAVENAKVYGDASMSSS